MSSLPSQAGSGGSGGDPGERKPFPAFSFGAAKPEGGLMSANALGALSTAGSGASVSFGSGSGTSSQPLGAKFGFGAGTESKGAAAAPFPGTFGQAAQTPQSFSFLNPASGSLQQQATAQNTASGVASSTPGTGLPGGFGFGARAEAPPAPAATASSNVPRFAIGAGFMSSAPAAGQERPLSSFGAAGSAAAPGTSAAAAAARQPPQPSATPPAGSSGAGNWFAAGTSSGSVPVGKGASDAQHPGTASGVAAPTAPFNIPSSAAPSSATGTSTSTSTAPGNADRAGTGPNPSPPFSFLARSTQDNARESSTGTALFGSSSTLKSAPDNSQSAATGHEGRQSQTAGANRPAFSFGSSVQSGAQNQQNQGQAQPEQKQQPFSFGAASGVTTGGAQLRFAPPLDTKGAPAAAPTIPGSSQAAPGTAVAASPNAAGGASGNAGGSTAPSSTSSLSQEASGTASSSLQFGMQSRSDSSAQEKATAATSQPAAQARPLAASPFSLAGSGTTNQDSTNTAQTKQQTESPWATSAPRASATGIVISNGSDAAAPSPAQDVSQKHTSAAASQALPKASEQASRAEQALPVGSANAVVAGHAAANRSLPFDSTRYGGFGSTQPNAAETGAGNTTPASLRTANEQQQQQQRESTDTQVKSESRDLKQAGPVNREPQVSLFTSPGAPTGTTPNASVAGAGNGAFRSASQANASAGRPETKQPTQTAASAAATTQPTHAAQAAPNWGPVRMPSAIEDKNVGEITVFFRDTISRLVEQFHRQAQQVARLDRQVIEQQERLVQLLQETEHTESLMQHMEKELDFILQQQSELHKALTTIEEQVRGTLSLASAGEQAWQAEFAASLAGAVEQEREKYHRIAEQAKQELDQVYQVIGQCIRELNHVQGASSGELGASTSSVSNAAAGVFGYPAAYTDDEQVPLLTILNVHLDTLELLSTQKNDLEHRITELEKVLHTITADPRFSLPAARPQAALR
jgi:cyclophilin family peptidyl-prolyl cis-trans isomerase